ncbi:hypothetical protein GW17_00024611 [Ensete ventricosum]|nr:hypothetical protein GW17_00024611 [Ensete ventricosum]
MLPPARVAARRNARRGGAHEGATHGRDVGHKGTSTCPLVGRLSVGKGNRRLHKGGDDAVRPPFFSFFSSSVPVIICNYMKRCGWSVEVTIGPTMPW